MEEKSSISEQKWREIEKIFASEMATTDDVKAGLQLKQNGSGPRQSIENCMLIFRYDPLLRNKICRNELTGRIDITGDLGWKRRGATITDTDVNQLKLYFESEYGMYNEKSMRTALDIISNENSFHPIKQYLEGLHWDGTSRMRALLPKYLGCDDDEYTYSVIRLLMMAAIERVYHPGCKYEIMVCLVGGQGAGKSTFFRLLAGNDEWFSDDLRWLNDDNVYRRLTGHWFIEMSEMLAMANMRSINEIKSFLSRQKDTYKVPYETYPEDRPRNCVFVGTSNDLGFLPLDRTGNRRFAPVLVHPERVEHHILEDEAASRKYIEQAWAEAMEMYRKGNIELKLSGDMERYLMRLQEQFMPEDTKAGLIQNWLDHTTEEYVCGLMIYREALHHDNEPKIYETKEISEIMSNSITGWQSVSSHRFRDYGTQRAWKRITDENGFTPIIQGEEIPFQ